MKIRRYNEDAGRSSTQRVPPGTLPWDKTRHRPPPAEEWAPNRLAGVWLKCHCFTIPWPLVVYLGVEWVLCDEHGEQQIEKHPPDRYRRTPSPYGYTIEGQDELV